MPYFTTKPRDNWLPYTKSERHLVSNAIQMALLKLGSLELDSVILTLKKAYNCSLEDCLEHPEYLKRVLSDLFGNGSSAIMNSIHLFLELENNNGKINEFLVVLGSK